MKYTLPLLLVILLGCQPVGKEKASPLRFFTVQKQDMNHLINQKALPQYPDLTADKTILNRDYPIEVALYNDGKWYYDLPNLDTGTGTWHYEDGVIKLHAERKLFDMHIEVVATKEKAEEVVLKFSDRFGPRILPTEKMNQRR